MIMMIILIAANIYITLYAKPVLSPLYILTIVALTINLRGRHYYYPHFIDGDTEAQRNSMMCPNIRAMNWAQAQTLATERYDSLELWPGLCVMRRAGGPLLWCSPSLSCALCSQQDF